MTFQHIRRKYIQIVNSWHSMDKAKCTNITNKLYGKVISAKLYCKALMEETTLYNSATWSGELIGGWLVAKKSRE